VLARQRRERQVDAGDRERGPQIRPDRPGLLQSSLHRAGVGRERRLELECLCQTCPIPTQPGEAGRLGHRAVRGHRIAATEQDPAEREERSHPAKRRTQGDGPPREGLGASWLVVRDHSGESRQRRHQALQIAGRLADGNGLFVVRAGHRTVAAFSVDVAQVPHRVGNEAGVQSLIDRASLLQLRSRFIEPTETVQRLAAVGQRQTVKHCEARELGQADGLIELREGGQVGAFLDEP
jgi:hypothetical protein